MFRSRLHQQVCASCRLQQVIAAKQLARSRNESTRRAISSVRSFNQRPSLQRTTPRAQSRKDVRKAIGAEFHTTQHHEPPSQDATETSDARDIGLTKDVAGVGFDGIEGTAGDGETQEDHPIEGGTIEEVVRKLRQTYGDRLPDGLLDEAQGAVWARLYGRPLKTIEELEAVYEEDEYQDSGVSKLRDGKWEEVELEETEEAEDLAADARELQDDMTDALEEDIDDFEDVEEERVPGALPVSRLHPLTMANRFSTEPSTLVAPKDTLTDLISILLGSVQQKHLTSAAHKIFGGFGLPDSTSTPRLGKVLRQNKIPLDVSQYRMSDMEADVYMSVLMTAVYASTMSVLVETRKRLGTAWAEGLVRKAEAGNLRIFDAGGAGMGVLAVRDLLKAEWERMHEEATNPGGGALATADGKLGGAGASPPLGNATVFIASEALRHRASHILVNTTFVPRMPNYEHTTEAKQVGKYDIVIAPHTIWPIYENYARKAHISNLWSMLNAEGGVLCLIEKGVARGFEAIAGARQQLLKRIATTDAAEMQEIIDEEGESEANTATLLVKEPGMIIAPCTNHVTCPMYKGNMQGVIKGRQDICHFRQRYVRPTFYQKILGAKDRNFEDVKFSYLSVMRGGDLRATKKRHASLEGEPVAMQGKATNERAFEGYLSLNEDADALTTDEPEGTAENVRPSSLSLPRTILPPLKRKGHIIMDMCTTEGEIERWTVPRSYSKQAFHDARKSEWGDLWALGAKTRVVRSVRLGKHAHRVDDKTGLSKKIKKEKRRVKERKAGKQGVLMKNDAS